MLQAVIDGNVYRIDDENPTSLVAYGGEAAVYWFNSPEFAGRYGPGRYVIKVYKDRGGDRQAKLQAFPTGLPRNVVTPLALAYDLRGQLIGYVMKFVPDGTTLIRYKSASYRREHHVTNRIICHILANLHDLVTELHRHGIVIGDFNDKNVLVTPSLEVYLLDADSFQFGKWESPVFVPGFVDPLIVASDGPGKLKKVRPHSQLTDWYAFAVMIFQLLVRVNPYLDGVYVPSDGKRHVKGAARVIRRISALHPGVSLPDTAVPLDTLPESFGRLFELVFGEHRRGVIPREILTDAQWTRCAQCHTHHGRLQCPRCNTATQRPTQQPQQPSPTPHRRPDPTTAPPPPRNPPNILAARRQGDRIRCVYHANGAYRREDGQIIWPAPKHDDRLTAIPAGGRTVFASDSSFAIFQDGSNSGQIRTQTVFGRATVAANSRYVYWLVNNQLVRDAYPSSGMQVIGTIAPHTTSVWVGERFGLAMTQAGVFNTIHVFDAHRAGFKSTSLPPSFDSVIDAQCFVGDDAAWLILSQQDGRGVVNRCYVIDSRAQLLATAEARRGDGTWLGTITTAAHADGNRLVTPIPRIGVIQLGINGGQVVQGAVYPDSSRLVTSAGATVAVCPTSRGATHFSSTTITEIRP